MQAPLLLQQTLTHTHGMTVQIPTPTPQVGCWPRGLLLASPAPQKITPRLPRQTATALIAELSVFSCLVKPFILVLLTFLKCVISSSSVFIFMKDSNFFEFLG